MRQAFLSVVLSTLAGLSATPAFAAKPPVVVELFTSQGCSSCGKANQVVAELADEKGVLALTYSVDYWDYLGWTDTFAKPAFAARQRAYATKFSLRDVPTPQVVVAGRQQAAGGKAEAIQGLIREAARAPSNPPDIEFIGGNRVAVGSGPAVRGGAEVWLVRYDPREQDIAVKRGDNRGQTLVHRNVVRELVKLGPWNGRPRLYRLSQPDSDELRTVVIVQGAKGGRVIGVLQDAPDK